MGHNNIIVHENIYLLFFQKNKDLLNRFRHQMEVASLPSDVWQHIQKLFQCWTAGKVTGQTKKEMSQTPLMPLEHVRDIALKADLAEKFSNGELSVIEFQMKCREHKVPKKKKKNDNEPRIEEAVAKRPAEEEGDPPRKKVKENDDKVSMSIILFPWQFHLNLKLYDIYVKLSVLNSPLIM